MDYSSFLDFLSTTAIDMTKKIADLELHPAHHRMQEWENLSSWYSFCPHNRSIQ